MPQRRPSSLALPPAVANAVWRGDHLLRTQQVCAPSGWAALDAELPGHGWPSHSLIEVLQAQAGQLEWRLAAAALQQQSAQRQAIVALGAPLPPHASGLAQQGIAPEQLVWVQGGSPQDQLWALEAVEICRRVCFSRRQSWRDRKRTDRETVGLDEPTLLG